MTTMKTTRKINYFLPVILSFYVMGFVDLVGVATGYVKNDFNLSHTTAQLLPSMVFIWFAIMAIPTGIFQDRKGKKITVVIGMVITGIGMLVPFISYSYITAVLGFAILGIGNTILQVSANPLLLELSTKESRAANLSMSQFVKAIASMVGPMLVAGLATYTGNWKLIFPLYAAVSLISALWLYAVKIEGSKSIERSKTDKKPATYKSVLSLLRHRYILITVGAIFFMVGFDVAINSNIANFLSTKFSISLESASIGISIYFASLMAGRFLGAILLRKIDGKKFLAISTAISLAGLIGLIISNDLNVTRVLIFITGLGFANLFPLMFTIIVENKPDFANELSSLIILALIGGAIVPPIMGMISDAYGVTTSIYMLIFCVLYIAYTTYYVIRH